MRSRHFIGLIAIGAALFVSTQITMVQAQVATAPTNASAKPIMSIEDMEAEIGKLQEKYSSVITPNLVTDEATRNTLAPTVLPVLKTIITYQSEIHRLNQSKFNHVSLEQMLAAAIGDDEILKELESGEKSSDEKIAGPSKSAMLVVHYWKSCRDAVAQNKILNAAETLATVKPDDEDLAGALRSMFRIGSANRQVHDRAAAILVGKMTGPIAMSVKLEQEGEAKLRLLENHPMVVHGTTLDGTDLSTDKWKGKVIVVDFWATWCGPCVAGLPRLEGAYQKFHSHGLEVISISNDFDAEKLRIFLTNHPAMAWPQLFSPDAAKQSEWHPVTRDFGIGSIPRMFLIDKTGTCRNVEPAEHLEEEIAKLLAE